MGWSDKMEEDAELEEGEAAYYKDDDDRCIDPDITLSYLDEKLQSVLGHFQKDFEGGVSAENLGAKFGGYGSFLPTYQRSPSMWSQPKSPPRVQSQSALKSPNHSHREGTSQNSTDIPDGQLSQRNATATQHIRQSSHETKVSLGDGTIKTDSCLSSAQDSEKLPVRHQPSPNKSKNPTDQRKLKFRIKVGSDTGNSHEESGGVPFDSRGTPNKSLGALQMWTAFTVAGDLMLSPLQDCFLNLLRNASLPPLKVKHGHSGANMDNGDALIGKQTKAVGKSEILKESKHSNKFNSEDDITIRLKDNSGAETPQKKQSLDMSQKRVSNSLPNTDKSSRDSSRVLDIVREPANGELIRKREVNKEKVIGRTSAADFFETFEVEHQNSKSGSAEKIAKNVLKGSQDISLDNSDGKRSKGNRILAPVKADSDFSESDRDSKKAADGLVKKSGIRATSHEQDESRKVDTTKKFDSKKKSRISQDNGKISSDSGWESRKVGSSLVAKEKNGIKKDAYKVRSKHKGTFETGLEPCFRPRDMLEKPSGDRSKDPKFDAMKEKHPHADKFKEKSSCNKSDNQLNSEMLVTNPRAGSLPPNNELALHTEQATMPSYFIEDWVCCDRCSQWRLLPYGTKAEQLPEKWLCSMLNWLPGMNRCDISEEETSKALRSLYQLPLPENQRDAEYHAEKPADAVNSVDQFNHNHQNIGLDYMADGRKKLQKLKETSSKGSKAGLIPTSTVKNSLQDAVKKGTLNDMKRSPAGVNPVNKSSGQHHSKSDTAVEKYSNMQKREHTPGGNANPKRKSQRESDPDEHGIRKKLKRDGAFGMNNSQNSGENLGRAGLNAKLPTVSHLIEKRRSSEPSHSKDSKAEEGNDIQHSARRRADLGGTASLEIKNYNDGEISAKKRNLVNWQNSPSNAETFPDDGSYLNENSLPPKEESSDSGFKRNKKPRISLNDGKETSRNMFSDEQKRKDIMARPPSSGGKENTVGRSSDKEKQLKRYRIKVASQLTMEDLESLKRDLGSEPLSTAATSSSSKVSDSRKTRTNYQELKGSPVESVSSSPVRVSNPNNFSAMRIDNCGADDVGVEDFPVTRNPRNTFESNGNYGPKSSGKEKKKKASVILHPDSFKNLVVGFPESGGRDKLGGKSEAGLGPSPYGNGHQDDSHPDILDGHNQVPSDLHASESCYSKGRVSKNHQETLLRQQISGKSSSLPPKDKGKTAGFSYKGTAGKVSDLPNNQGISHSKQSRRVEADADLSHAPSVEVSDNVNHPFPGGSGSKSVKTKNIVRMDSRKSVDRTGQNQLKCRELERPPAKLGNPCSVDTTVRQSLNQCFPALMVTSISTKVDFRDGNALVDRHCEDKVDIPAISKSDLGAQNGDGLPIQTCGMLTSADMSKESKDLQNTINQNESLRDMGHSAADLAPDVVGTSLVRRDASGQTAFVALKEAEDLRACADRLKNSGFGYECNEAYFQAALKFLQGASLLENSESGKHGEMNQLQIYTNTAKLCETCAQEYEKQEQMAAAALAYKCMEVAYMRVVYCKNSSTSRLWHDLQTSLQMVPQGESPSSSASDIDNLNNQALVDRASLSKSNSSHTGNNVIASRSRPNFARLLDFTKDVNSAMEASRKSQTAFSAANVILEEAQNKEGIVFVKRVIDFSFQDVEELVRLVRVAIEAISRQGFSGGRD